MKPQALQIGDQIGVVAPSSPCKTARWKKAVTLLQIIGYQVKIGDSVYEQTGYLAGSDEIRARDLNQMFVDPKVKAIFCLRGGYGVTRILPYLDYQAIQKNPKIIVGYSDITALHLAVYQQTGLITFHGPVLAELASHIHPLTAISLYAICSCEKPIGKYPVPSDAYTLSSGIAEGKLIGGNLSLLTASLGTPYEIETENKILFIEEVNEAPYRIDRMLTQLLQAGKLHKARGIVLTDFTNCEAEDKQKSFSLKKIFRERILPLGIPAFYGLRAGHCSPNLTLPIGGRIRINAEERSLTHLEGNVKQKQ